MADTSASLLDLLKDDPDSGHWRRFIELYCPLIRHWLRRHTLAASDTDDLVQEVLAVVVRRLPEFHRQPRTGAFRAWLRTITGNCLRDFWRAQRVRPRVTGAGDFQAVLEQLADSASALSRQWDEEHDRFVTRTLLDTIRPEFHDRTWRAFHGVAIDGRPPDDVAKELGVTVNAVFIAKSRVLSRLRSEAAGLIDDT
ncbi:MAG: RNA polymerase sigma factor [Planctomycetota bacterium]